MQKIKIKPIPVFILITFFGVIYYLNTHPPEYDRYGVLTEGTIYETSAGGRSGADLTLRYKYKVDGKEYERSSTYPNIYFAAGDRFLNKKFPVVYLDRPYSMFHRAMILVNRWDFEKAGIQFPDSLQWVEELEH